MSKMPVIYVGRCLTTNKVYVGSSRQGKRRVLSHLRDLKKGNHSNSYLQSAWNKYGSKDFVWYVVESCEKEHLQAREQWWIGFLRATDRQYGFNLCNAADDFSKQVVTQLAKAQIEAWRDPEIRSKRLVGLKKLHQDAHWKSKRSQALSAKWKDPEWRSKMLNVLKQNVDKLSERMTNEPGFKEHRMRGINGSTGRV